MGLQACGAVLSWKEHCQVQIIFAVEENISWYKKWERAGLKALRLTANQERRDLEKEDRQIQGQ